MNHPQRFFCPFLVILAGLIFFSCDAQNDEEASHGLVGYWKLTDDILDYSGNNLHGEAKSRNNEIDNLPWGSREKENSWVEIPSSSYLQFGDGDFSLAAMVNASHPESNVSGDLLSHYDPVQRKGFHLSIKTNPSPTGVGNLRQLSFGIDDKVATEWQDVGRPGNALLAFGLTAYQGDLYAATCEPEVGDAGRVYRYDSANGDWVDCGAPDGSNTVFALTEFEGILYAATGKYRVAGSSLPESQNTEFGGRVFKYKKPGQWIEAGNLPGVEAIMGLVVYKGNLYASSLYSP